MVARETPLFDARPDGFPEAVSTERAKALKFFIPAMDGDEVVPKDRPRARVVPAKKPWVQFYTPAKTVKWEDHVAEHALMELRSVEVDGPEFTMPIQDHRIIASMRFNLRKPVSYPKSVIWHTKKPDLDNYVKSILDALIKARVIEDDALVTDLILAKRYADDAHPPGVEVELICVAL